MGERVTMEWFEGEIDPHLPTHKKGLAVEISIAGEVAYYHAVTQPIASYRKSDCVKAIFYWLIDFDLFDEMDLSPPPKMPDDRQDIPF